VPQIARGNDFPSAIQYLRTQVDKLSQLCEERYGLRDAETRNPQSLRDLFDSVSASLNDVSRYAVDGITADAASTRQQDFDRVVDPIFDHMDHLYSRQNERWEKWADYRASLRKEMRLLNNWVDSFPKLSMLFP
jgi:hypothetical protein